MLGIIHLISAMLSCGCPELVVSTPDNIQLHSDKPFELTYVDWESELLSEVSALIYFYSGSYNLTLLPESGQFTGLDNFSLEINGEICVYSLLRRDTFALPPDKKFKVFSIEGKYLGEHYFSDLSSGVYIINRQIYRKL